MSNYEKETPIGLKVVSLLFPIVGWICYFVFKDNDIIKAKDCSKFAWIGFAISFALTLLGLIE